MTDSRQGIAFSLEGVDDLVFTRILLDLMNDNAFSKPLQVQAQEPRSERPAVLTLVFQPAHRSLALQAMQRLKTILLRYGVQVDQVIIPGE